jgi:translation initiation factor IF-2
MSKKMRVHELAKELNLDSNKLVLEFLANQGITKTASSNLEEEHIQLVKVHFENLLNLKSETQKTSDKIKPSVVKKSKPKESLTTQEEENEQSESAKDLIQKDNNSSKTNSKSLKENVTIKAKRKNESVLSESEKVSEAVEKNNISFESEISKGSDIKDNDQVRYSEPPKLISASVKEKILVKNQILRDKLSATIKQKEKVSVKDGESGTEVHQVRTGKIKKAFESYQHPVSKDEGENEVTSELQKRKIKEFGSNTDLRKVKEESSQPSSSGERRPNSERSDNRPDRRDNDRRPHSERPDNRPQSTTAPAPVSTDSQDRSKKDKDKKSKKDNRASDYKRKQAEEESKLLAKAMASKKKKKDDKKQEVVEEELSTEIEIFDGMNVKDLADKLRLKETEIIRDLFMKGMMVTVNQTLDRELVEKIVLEKGFTVKEAASKEDEILEMKLEEMSQDESTLELRPPVVTIMGHVDHGKTSLLDAIRKTKVTDSEAGGITQHIGAYQVNVNNRLITFLDTPGHEAFTAMRARGAKSTDIAVLVVAADDGIMPQTIEAINHAKAASVPIIVAINKIDKPDANPERVKQQLSEHDLIPEDWGGTTVMVEVSARARKNLDELLEMILLTADIQDIRSNPNKAAQGVIIESKLDKGKGPVATILVQAGTLKIGDNFVIGTVHGKVRAMFNYLGTQVKEAPPSAPVQIIGCSSVPLAGELLKVVGSDKEARDIAEKAQFAEKEKSLSPVRTLNLESLSEQVAEGKIKELNLVIKADVQGSAEALEQSLSKINVEDVKLRIIHSAVGDVTETDVTLAAASSGIIIAFNVRVDAKVREMAEKESIDVRSYNIIYRVIEDVQKALEGMLEPELEEVTIGKVQVRAIFTVGKTHVIAGCYVTEGKVTRNSTIKVLRDNKVIHTGKISSLKRFKDDVKEVLTGFECGISLDRFNDILENDVFEASVIQTKTK